jgi:DNA-binding NtrC family response regulator
MEAIERLGAERFDVVLSEQALQPMYGTELMAVVRRLSEHTRRIVMSDATETPEIRSAIDVGNVHRFVSKPIKPEHLLPVGARRSTDAIQCAIVDRDQARADSLVRSLAPFQIANASVVTAGTSAEDVEADMVLIVEPESVEATQPFIAALRARRPATWIVLALPPWSLGDVTAYRTAGADDFVSFPVRPEEVFLRHHARSLERPPKREAPRGPAAPSSLPALLDIVAGTEAMNRVLEQVQQVAASDASVLLSGETGTGKEVIARAIHALSPRRAAPFLALNLSAVPESLVEGELFGHEKGAFTGAQTSRPGRLDAVNGGVLFLDEVGDLSLSVQVKLLRVLEQRTFERLGSTVSRQSDFRLICATHRDLDAMIGNETFREDLYYRINVVRINLPPLRERRDDIPRLVEFFLQRFAEKYGAGRRVVTDAAMEALMRHDWPGNVRELQHIVERAVAMSSENGVIDETVLWTRKRRVSFNKEIQRDLSDGRGLREILADIERKIIAETLERFGGNQLAAARKLAIPRQTLQNRLKKYRL